MIATTLVFAALAFTLSASAGLGGSLILVPAMALLLGPKEGIAVAALLLAANNVAKVAVYHRTIPLASALGVVLVTVLGAGIGARLLVSAPEFLVTGALLASVLLSFLLEHKGSIKLRRSSVPALAFAAGTCSGFAGTSGPLKGIALRGLGLDRMHFVGAASLVSLCGDLAKVAVFSQAALFHESSATVVLATIPMMPVAAFLGKRINREVGERGYAMLFWAVMAGYSARAVSFALG
jgi:hypothetical protein